MKRRIRTLLLVLLVTQTVWADNDNVNHVVMVLNTIAIVGITSAIIHGALKYIQEIRRAKELERDNFKKSFGKLVSQLNSDNPSAQLSASILLRRYFKDTPEDDKKELRKEAIDVISSLLRVASSGPPW